MKERIIRYQPRPEDDDIVGKPISPERLAELYQGRENLVFWDFVQKLRKNNWSKFCVSRAMLDYDPDMRFFEIGKVRRQEAPEIIYLGLGKAPETTEIKSQFAAETWSFAVLKLGGEEEKSRKESEV